MLSAEANDLCEADKKKTITPGHILRAMEKLGLERTLHRLATGGASVYSGAPSPLVSAGSRVRGFWDPC